MMKFQNVNGINVNMKFIVKMMIIYIYKNWKIIIIYIKIEKL